MRTEFSCFANFPLRNSCSRRRISLLIAFLFVTSAATPAQDTTQIFLRDMREVIVQGLNFNAGDTNQLQVLSEPIILEDYTGIPSQDETTFTLFDRVPASGASLFLTDPKAPTISEILAKIIPLIQLGKVVLTQEEEQEVRDATNFLYENGDHNKPSAKYAKYLDFQSRYNALTKSLQSATSAAEKANIQTQISILERNWSLSGYREDVDSNLNILASKGGEDTAAIKADWVATVKASKSGDYGQVWPALARFNDWVITNASLPQPTHKIPLLSKGAKSEQWSQVQISEPTQLAMRICRVGITRPALEHPFFRSRQWKINGAWVLSDGNPLRDVDSELMPRIVSELVLVKGIEIVLGSEEDWKIIATALKNSAEVKLGGLPIQHQAKKGYYLAPKMLALIQPYVIGVVISAVPKIPDPLPGLKY